MALALVVTGKNVIPVEEITFLYGKEDKENLGPLTESNNDHEKTGNDETALP